MNLPIIKNWDMRRKLIVNSVAITILAIMAGIIAGLLTMNMVQIQRFGKIRIRHPLGNVGGFF